jgi:hypothetical protein
MGKRGPRPRGEYENKTAVFSTRIRPDTRRALEAARIKSGRSLSQELEHRLRQSFHEDKVEITLFGNKQNAAIVRLLGLQIRAVGTNWFDDDPGAWLRSTQEFDEVRTAMVHALSWFHPDPQNDRLLFYHSKAAEILEEIATADPTIPLSKTTPRQHAMVWLKDRLGELVSSPQPLAAEMKRRGRTAKVVPPTRRHK